MPHERILIVAYALLIVLVLTCIQSCAKQRPKSNLNDSLATSTSQHVADSISPRVRTLGSDEKLLPLPEADTLTDTQFPDSIFLRNGELWASNLISSTERMLTHTQSQIDTFFVSPSCRYVACLRRVGLIDSPGIYEEGERVPKEPVHEILVFDLLTQHSIRQFEAPEDIFLHFHEWISKSRFVFCCADGFAVNAFYVYDAYRDSLQKVYYGFPK